MEPKSLRKYKVQLHTNEPLDMRKFAKVSVYFTPCILKSESRSTFRLAGNSSDYF